MFSLHFINCWELVSVYTEYMEVLRRVPYLTMSSTGVRTTLKRRCCWGLCGPLFSLARGEGGGENGGNKSPGSNTMCSSSWGDENRGQRSPDLLFLSRSGPADLQFKRFGAARLGGGIKGAYSCVWIDPRHLCLRVLAFCAGSSIWFLEIKEKNMEGNNRLHWISSFPGDRWTQRVRPLDATRTSFLFFFLFC